MKRSLLIFNMFLLLLNLLLIKGKVYIVETGDEDKVKRKSPHGARGLRHER